MPRTHSRRGLWRRLERQQQIAGDETRRRRDRVRAARAAARLAEQLGLIERPRRCTWCRRPVRLEKHHWDYASPLLVTYLCHECHGLADAMVAG